LQRKLDAQQRASHGKRDQIETAPEEAPAGREHRQADRRGRDAPRSLNARLNELEAEQKRLEEELAGLPDRVVVRLPANYEAVYRSAIAQLEQHLARLTPHLRARPSAP